MSRGPRPRRTLAKAIPLAQVRGKVQLAECGPESLYDLSIVSVVPVAFVRTKFAPRILATLAEIGAEFKDDIIRLSLISHDAAISRELWLRSKHGTWRFFRILADGLVELGRDGRVLAEGGVSVM